MSNAKQIIAMLQSQLEGDEEQFYSIALQVAASEARQGHRSTADTLRKAVEAARLAKAKAPVAIPFAAPRGDLAGLITFRDPKLKLKDVTLDGKVVDRLGNVLRQQNKRTWLHEHGRQPSRRLLFVGPPGSGKTMTAEAVAGELRLPLLSVRLDALITRYMGETATKLRLIFDETLQRRGVYLFDEFDALGTQRSATNDVAEMRRVLNSFLQFMEEETSTDSLIIAATNHPELLDRALLRRFDAVLPFDMPSDDEIQAIVAAALRPFKADDYQWSKIIEAAARLSQAEIARATEDAVKDAILDESDQVGWHAIVLRLHERREMQEVFSTTTSG